MGYINQAQHKPSARAKKTLNYQNSHTYEVLQQGSISIEIIAGEKQYSLWYQHKKNKIFPLKLHLNPVSETLCFEK
jgi:hypothetical protein